MVFILSVTTIIKLSGVEQKQVRLPRCRFFSEDSKPGDNPLLTAMILL